MDKLISFDELGRLLENFSDHFKGSTVQNDDLQYIISYILPYLRRYIESVIIRDYSIPQIEKINAVNGQLYKLFKDCIDKYQNSSSIENLGVEFEVIVQFYSENRSQLDLILLFAEHNKSLRTLNSSKNNIENLNSNFSKLSNEIQNISEGLEEVAKSVTIPKYAEVYEVAKQEYDKIANKWLWVGVVLSVLLVVSIILVLYCVPMPTYQSNDNPFVYIITNFSLRFTLIGIFLYLLYFVGHKYNVAKHNATLYGSKSAALKSFLAFIQTTSDNEVKNAMLIAITDFIFKGNNTGYLENDKGIGDLNPNNVMNVLSDLIHKTK
jgi:hypothetical protein